MTTIREQILAVDQAIDSNLAILAGNRELLSQNILSQLRNLIEAACVGVRAGSLDGQYNFQAIEAALSYVSARGQYKRLIRFHRLLQVSTSHYTLDGDASERLMLRYYEHLWRLRTLFREKLGIEVLANLEQFPVDLDPALREYHQKIAARISVLRAQIAGGRRSYRYYIHSIRPFFIGDRIYYEVSFQHASNRVSKAERIIAFTDIELSDAYAANLNLAEDSIDVLGRQMPITVITGWEVSIRPCEFDNFARLFGIRTDVRTASSEYKYLMRTLTATSDSLLDIIALPDDRYGELRSAATAAALRPAIFPALDEARRIIRTRAAGQNLLRYLLLHMRNTVLRQQYDSDGCERLSGLNVSYSCIPFDTMPFCTSPVGHNPRFWDLAEAIDASGRTHELLARHVKTNVEQRGILYTPASELEHLGDVTVLINRYNAALYYKHQGRRLVQDKGYIVMQQYEDDTVSIIKTLQMRASSGVDGYAASVDEWLSENPEYVDDEAKRAALRLLFDQSHVALIYGAAGTGKSTMVNHIAQLFNEDAKLFLAHTNPAVDNLKRRVTADNSTFRTIASHRNQAAPQTFQLVVLDECSTISNADLIDVLAQTTFQTLVLVGDVHQIESIEFGNWFAIARAFLPRQSVFELTTPYRTKNPSLLTFWNKLRELDEDMEEILARSGYSTKLDESLFQAQRADEIVLSLNYDGLYGINNINRFLQSSNPSPAVTWRSTTYKVGDPILFNEIRRFAPLIYNNLKGKIVNIQMGRGRIIFDVELDRDIDGADLMVLDLVWLGGSTVRFEVHDYDVSDADNDTSETTVPFQVAYAVSIHKAQGLEYDSVKVVVTGASQDQVTHNIFYTAVTRARETLKIFWTPETQQKVMRSFEPNSNNRDVQLLKMRSGILPAAP